MRAAKPIVPIVLAAGMTTIVGASSALADPTIFVWEGDVNNNWQNHRNWDQIPGSGDVPDAPDHFVTFDDTAAQNGVDLNDNDRSVGILIFNLPGTVGFFIHSSTGNGILRNYGDLLAGGAELVLFDDTITYYQEGNGEWDPNNDPVYTVFEAEVAGSGAIELLGGVTLMRANSYDGVMTITGGGRLRLRHDNAMRNASVVLNRDNGLDVTSHPVNARLGALSGTGDVALGSQTLYVGLKGLSTTYSGVITGTANARLVHDGGTGTLTLSGGDDATPSSFGTLQVLNGAVVVHGARMDLTSISTAQATQALLTQNADVTVRNGADVRATGGKATAQQGTLTITGDGTSMSINRLDAASVTGGAGSVVIAQNASLTVGNMMIIGLSGSGNLTVESGADVSAPDFFLGIASTATGGASITGQGTLVSSNRLSLGGQSIASSGGTGQLFVTDQAALQVAGETRFFTTTSNITVNEATYQTDTLLNLSGGAPVFNISNPTTGGPALTVGTGNGSSTWDGFLQNSFDGPGTLAKVGTGTLTLTRANPYSGGTIIDGGTLLTTNATGSATGPGFVTVNDGGTLGGTGQVGGPVTVNAGGVIAPGSSPGLLTIDDNLELAAGSILAIEIGGVVPGSGYDVLSVTGNVNLGGTLAITRTGGFEPSLGLSFAILPYGSRTGAFTRVTGLKAGPGRVFRPVYTAEALTLVVGPPPSGDLDADGDVDGDDLDLLASCSTRDRVPHDGPPVCEQADVDDDNDVDLNDFGVYQRCFSGANVPADPACSQ